MNFDRWVLDQLGSGWFVGPQSLYSEKRRRELLARMLQTAHNIASGPVGTIGWFLGGDAGSDAGALVDQGAVGGRQHPAREGRIQGAVEARLTSGRSWPRSPERPAPAVRSPGTPGGGPRPASGRDRHPPRPPRPRWCRSNLTDPAGRDVRHRTRRRLRSARRSRAGPWWLQRRSRRLRPGRAQRSRGGRRATPGRRVHPAGRSRWWRSTAGGCAIPTAPATTFRITGDTNALQSRARSPELGYDPALPAGRVPRARRPPGRPHPGAQARRRCRGLDFAVVFTDGSARSVEQTSVTSAPHARAEARQTGAARVAQTAQRPVSQQNIENRLVDKGVLGSRPLQLDRVVPATGRAGGEVMVYIVQPTPGAEAMARAALTARAAS